MNFQEAKAKSEALYARMNQTNKVLQQFPKGNMGLTPDHIKFSPEFKAAKHAFDVAFQELRQFNAYFTKAFKKELREERARRYIKLS